MTRRIVQLAGARAEFALADDGSIWLWTGSGWQDASRGPLPEPIGRVWPEASLDDYQRGLSAVALEAQPLTLREEIDQKKADLVKDLGLKKRGRPKKEKP